MKKSYRNPTIVDDDDDEDTKKYHCCIPKIATISTTTKYFY